MANVKLPKFAQIDEMMNNSSAWLETIKFLTCLVLYAIHQMAPFFVISWFHIVWCFTSTYLQQNQTQYEYPISRCVLYQKRKNKNVLFSNHSTQTARYVYWSVVMPHCSSYSLLEILLVDPKNIFFFHKVEIM